ncbi:uncharacterized protein LOC107982092 [Nasonia vitripennis]|uniref:Ionotropic receptor n=1 Tax=Nasonia vitripennis TaxID=7425 RepID=A0A7M7IXB0_NASVI|nr:uncharacterized protein LOC107982092 [Nasonia vitripennis]XP_016845035.1 uncharacterized protein LOC107982092 [Nasonia vitripennis]
MRKSAYYWIVLIYIPCKIASADIDVAQIWPNSDLHQVTILTNHLPEKGNSILRNILNSFPTLCIDSQKLRSASQVLRQSENSKLYIFLHDDLDVEFYKKRLYEVLHLIVQVAPVSTRPKCLAFFHSSTDNDDWALEEILIYAWHLKFLDFSIVKMRVNGESVILSYNPFTRIFSASPLDSVVFPDKLHDMQGFGFLVPVAYRPPYIFINHDQATRKVKSIEGSSYFFLKTLSEKLNFTLITPILKQNITLDGIFDTYESTGARMSMVPVLVNSLSNRSFIVGRFFSDEKFVLIVPIISETKLRGPIQILIYLACFVVIMLCFVLIAGILRFPLSQWRIIDVYQLLLGVALAKKQPSNCGQRIVYLSLVLVSMKYSGDTIAMLTGFSVEMGEKPFESFDEIVKSHVPVYMSKLFLNQVYSRSDEVFNNLRMKPEIYGNFDDCIRNLVDRKSSICITPNIHGEFTVAEKNAFSKKRRNGGRVMKLAKVSLYPDKSTYFYESGSPFVERIERIERRTYESGLVYAWKTNQKFNRSVGEGTDEAEVKDLLLTEMIAVAGCGCGVACVVFVVELVVAFLWRREKVRQR